MVAIHMHADGMPVSVETYESQILLAILAEVEVSAEIPAATCNRIVADLWSLGVRYQPALWTNEPKSPSVRMAFTRATRRLVAAGQVARRTEPNRDRTTHLVVTQDGLRRALELAGAAADRAAVAKGLRQTAWGHALSVSA